MDYIFIPYGSFVIRSMALFHSGHYGSPGNTRLHAVVFLKGATTNTAELGYLRTLVNKKSSSLAAGWKHEWSSQVKPKFQQAFSVMEYSNPSTGVLKNRGDAYHRKIVSLKCHQMKTQFLMLNPTPPKTLIVQLPRRKLDPTLPGEDDTNNKRQSSGEEVAGPPVKQSRLS